MTVFPADNRLEIRILTDADTGMWDDYVDSNVEARYSHLVAYRRVLQDVYRFQPHYTALFLDGRVKGILPAFVVGLPWARKCISVPFSQFGGPIIDILEEGMPQVVERMAAEAVVGTKSRRIEMRGLVEGIPSLQGAIISTTRTYDYAVLDLDVSESELFSGRFEHSVRKAIHKAEREDVSSVEDSTSSCIERYFYPLYLRTMKRLGTPPHPIDFFLSLRYHFADRMKIFWAVYRGKYVSGLLGISTAKRVNILYIVSDERFRDVRPNDVVHWAYIQWARRNGYRCFDFGVARYDGQRQFKRKWGTTFHPYRILRFDERGVKEFPGKASSHKLLVDIWKYMVPLKATAVLGKHLRRIYAQ